MVSRFRVTVAIVIVLLAGLTMIFSIPLNPQIAGYVSISTNSDNQPGLTLISLVYQRINLLSGISESKDRIEVQQSSANNTQTHPRYFLSIVVHYQGQLVTQGGSDVTDGVIFFQASFWSRPETANLPYVVTFTVSNDGYYYETVEATLQPS